MISKMFHLFFMVYLKNLIIFLFVFGCGVKSDIELSITKSLKYPQDRWEITIDSYKLLKKDTNFLEKSIKSCKVYDIKYTAKLKTDCYLKPKNIITKFLKIKKEANTCLTKDMIIQTYLDEGKKYTIGEPVCIERNDYIFNKECTKELLVTKEVYGNYIKAQRIKIEQDIVVLLDYKSGEVLKKEQRVEVCEETNR
jgi:hypothetical protein